MRRGVLSGFKNNLRPQVLVVENCFGPIGSTELRNQIRSMGYSLVARISYIDDIYVHVDFPGEIPNLRKLRNLRRDLFR